MKSSFIIHTQISTFTGCCSLPGTNAITPKDLFYIFSNSVHTKNPPNNFDIARSLIMLIAGVVAHQCIFQYTPIEPLCCSHRKRDIFCLIH